VDECSLLNKRSNGKALKISVFNRELICKQVKKIGGSLLPLDAQALYLAVLVQPVVHAQCLGRHHPSPRIQLLDHRNTFWGGPKKSTPKWMVIMENHNKMDDLGVPLFSETTILVQKKTL
jgi:hypothetical protein